jgi:hypothetical protein
MEARARASSPVFFWRGEMIGLKPQVVFWWVWDRRRGGLGEVGAGRDGIALCPKSDGSRLRVLGCDGMLPPGLFVDIAYFTLLWGLIGCRVKTFAYSYLFSIAALGQSEET